MGARGSICDDDIFFDVVFLISQRVGVFDNDVITEMSVNMRVSRETMKTLIEKVRIFLQLLLLQMQSR